MIQATFHARWSPDQCKPLLQVHTCIFECVEWVCKPQKNMHRVFFKLRQTDYRRCAKCSSSKCLNVWSSIVVYTLYSGLKNIFVYTLSDLKNVLMPRNQKYDIPYIIFFIFIFLNYNMNYNYNLNNQNSSQFNSRLFV